MFPECSQVAKGSVADHFIGGLGANAMRQALHVKHFMGKTLIDARDFLDGNIHDLVWISL
jgi:hypothetical protein